MSVDSLEAVYATAAALLNDGCLRAKNASACTDALHKFQHGQRLLRNSVVSHTDEAQVAAIELFTRGVNVASRTRAAYLAERTAKFACARATDEHNLGRHVLALVLQVRCDAALRHLSRYNDDVESPTRHGHPASAMVVTRSALLLRSTVIPRHQVSTNSTDGALLSIASRDLCRLHGRLRVSVLGGMASHARKEVVRRACPAAAITTADDGLHDMRRCGWAHLVHLEADGFHEWYPTLRLASCHLARGGALLCHGCASSAHATVCTDGQLVMPASAPSITGDTIDDGHETTGADQGEPLGRACQIIPELAPNPDAPTVMFVVDPAGPDAMSGTAERVDDIDTATDDVKTMGRRTDDVHSVPGACAGGVYGDAYYPGLVPPPWGPHTFVVSGRARRSRWAADADAGNVTIIEALTPAALPAALLTLAFDTIVDGIANPPTDRAYAAHSAGVMIGHIAAWEAAATELAAATTSSSGAEHAVDALPAYALIVEDDAARTPSFARPPLPSLVAELAAHDPEWDLLILHEPPPQRLSDVLSDASHAPELSLAEMTAPPTRATPNLMRIAPTHKAVAWVLSPRFLARLLAEQAARPYYGPVDVWVWRQRRADGGAVRAYAPLMAWVEEDATCRSHHAPSNSEPPYPAAHATQVGVSVHAPREPDVSEGEDVMRCPSELPQLTRTLCEKAARGAPITHLTSHL